MRVLCLIVYLSLAASLGAASLKKVLILDFKNVLRKSQYNYLEPSITNTIREKLKKRFAFQEIEKEKWRDVAAENFIAEEDLYTSSAAMTLGLLLKQDIVIFGGYVIEGTKKSDTPEITTRVRILDLAKRKEITDFETKNKVDSTFFTATGAIADRIVAEAKGILPNAEDWARGSIAEDIPRHIQISLRGQLSTAMFGDSDRMVDANKRFTGDSLRAAAGVAVDFQYLGILREQLGLTIGGGAQWGSDEFRYALDTSAVPVSLQRFSGYAGILWRQRIFKRLFISPIAGGGIQHETMRFSYGGKTVAAASATGQELNSSELRGFAPIALGGLRLSYAVAPWLYIEAGLSYSYVFYTDAGTQRVAVDAGIGFKL